MTHGNKYLRRSLIEISWSASRKRNCFFSDFSYIQTTVKKKSRLKIQVAIARKNPCRRIAYDVQERELIDIYHTGISFQLVEERYKFLSSCESMQIKKMAFTTFFFM